MPKQTHNMEPTLQQAIIEMVTYAVKNEYITADGNRVMLSIDLLTQLGCVPEGTKEEIDLILERFLTKGEVSWLK